VKLQIFGRTISNFTEGTLSAEEETVTSTITNDNRKPGRVIGIKEDVTDFTVLNSGKLQFQQSDAITDAGQNFVPYFDANDVSFQSPAPISSIGLIHYTNDKLHSGYIKPTLKSVYFGIYAKETNF
jgi:hypothetical protein